MNQTEIKERQQEMLSEGITRLDHLLDEAENLQLNNSLDKWIVSRCLLVEIPLIEELFKACECKRTEQLIKKLRKIANNLSSVSHLGCYT